MRCLFVTSHRYTRSVYTYIMWKNVQYDAMWYDNSGRIFYSSMKCRNIFRQTNSFRCANRDKWLKINAHALLIVMPRKHINQLKHLIYTLKHSSSNSSTRSTHRRTRSANTDKIGVHKVICSSCVAFACCSSGAAGRAQATHADYHWRVYCGHNIATTKRFHSKTNHLVSYAIVYMCRRSIRVDFHFIYAQTHLMFEV